MPDAPLTPDDTTEHYGIPLWGPDQPADVERTVNVTAAAADSAIHAGVGDATAAASDAAAAVLAPAAQARDEAQAAAQLAQLAGITALTATQRNALSGSSRPVGRVIYNTTTALYEGWSGSAWIVLSRATLTQTFTASGVWTKPAGAVSVCIVCIGGGAGGGGVTFGGGGGGGGYSTATMPATSLPATVPITVGAGGAAGGKTSGTGAPGNGGTSSASTHAAAGGGIGTAPGSAAGTTNVGAQLYDGGTGLKPTATVPGPSAAYGGGAGGFINQGTIAGGASGALAGAGEGGAGASRSGSGLAGSGGGPGYSGLDAGAGGTPGGGGGGCNSATGAAGAGARGEVVITTYF